MRNIKYINVPFALLLGLSLTVFYSCERNFSDDVEYATFARTGEIFTDAPVGLGSDFYFPFENSKATAFSVDPDVAFESEASIRIDVPNANDPEGSFAGAIFRIDGAGRNLTDYDALTFYAKASRGVIIGEIGFGQDFGENKYQVTRTNVNLGTDWAKYVIPIPDPSKLIEERGMLWYSAGTAIALADQLGIVSVLNTGEATITATLANVAAAGSLALTVTRAFEFAPLPPARDPSDVISIFSDAYANIAVDYYNGFFIPDGQTTQGGEPPLDINGDMVINYTDLNFVGIGFFDDVPSVNATDMTTLHIDIKVNEAIGPGDFIRLELLNSVGNNQTSGAYTIDGSALTTDQWVSLDIPLADFTGLSDRSQIGLLFFISDSTISDIFVDNIYFYR